MVVDQILRKIDDSLSAPPFTFNVHVGYKRHDWPFAIIVNRKKKIMKCIYCNKYDIGLHSCSKGRDTTNPYDDIPCDAAGDNQMDNKPKETKNEEENKT